MISYWLSFRLHDKDGWQRTYQKRLDALRNEIELASGGGRNWWTETTSFYIFSSAEGIDAIVTRVKRAVAEQVDIVVIGQNAYLGGRVVGNCSNQDIFTLAPSFTKV